MPAFDKLSMNSLLFANLSIDCEIFKILKQHPNGSKTIYYLRLASRMRGLLGSDRPGLWGFINSLTLLTIDFLLIFDFSRPVLERCCAFAHAELTPLLRVCARTLYGS